MSSMYPDTLAPKPLRHATFYILLALSRGELHAYSLMAAVRNDSLGGLELKSGYFYPLLEKLFGEGLIEMTGERPAGKSGKSRMHYGLAAEGRLRLKDELKRLRHATRIGETAGLFDDDTPTDIQRLLDAASH